LQWQQFRRHATANCRGQRVCGLPPPAAQGRAAIDERDRYGGTALHHAATNGHAEICGLLVGAGAFIAARDHDGRTALYKAAKWEHVAACCRLLDAGADPTTAHWVHDPLSDWRPVDKWLDKLVAVRAAVAEHERAKLNTLFGDIKHAAHK